MKAAKALSIMRFDVLLFALLGACWLLAANGCATDTGERGTTPAALAPRDQNESNAPASAQFERGARLAARADYTNAERPLVEALTGGYPAARVLPLLLTVCRNAGHLSAAVDYATPYLQLHPADFSLRYRVAELLFELGRFERTASELRRVLEIAPNHASAHSLLAVTLRDHVRD
jgi:Flp pilus assembly protein TadD